MALDPQHVGSPRRVVLEVMSLSAKQLRNGRYFVKRGALNYTTHDWQRNPFTIAIMQDEGALLGHRRQVGGKQGVFTLEMFGPMDANTVREIDDELIDELIEDVEVVMNELMDMGNGTTNGVNQYPIIFKLEKESARFVETHDVDLEVVGIVATFQLTY